MYNLITIKKGLAFKLDLFFSKVLQKELFEIKNIFKIIVIVVVGVTMSLGMYIYKSYVLKPEPNVVYIKDSDNKQVEVSIETEEELEETINKVLEEENTGSNDKELSVNTDKPKQDSKNNHEAKEVKEDKEDKEDNRKTEKEIIDKYKSQFYSMQTGYTSKISSMLSSAKNEYYAIPEEDRTSSVKAKIGLKYYDIAKSLERECDNEVDSILNSMEKELDDNNYSTKTIELIKNYYENQKSSQKQYYMSKITGK